MYGKGENFDDRKRWERVDKAQRGAAALNDAAIWRLKNAADAMDNGKLDSASIRTMEDFEKAFGDEAATAANMRGVAQRYEQANAALRDTSQFKVNAHNSKEFYAIRTGASPDSMGSAPNGSTRMDLNFGHDDIGKDEKLMWTMAHEALHGRGSALRDYKIPGVTRNDDEIGAYKFDRGGGGRKLFEELKDDPGQTLINPDHLVSFAQDFGLTEALEALPRPRRKR